MQARYIPSVLHYIASKSSAFFIWGFEEPENSLEFSAADALADDLQFRYSNDAQIFTTSHSPAMVSRSGENVACYRVWQPKDQTEVERIDLETKDSAPAKKLQQEIGLLRIQKEIHGEYKAKLSELELISERISHLENEIQNQRLPLVLVEGPTDRAILETAWSKLRPATAIPFMIRVADPLENIPGGGNGGAASLAKAIESIHPADNRRVLAIFDHDQEGIKAFDSLSKNFKTLDNCAHEKNHANGYAAAMTLAIADETHKNKEAQNFCIEYMFDEHILNLRNHDGKGLEFKNNELVIAASGKRIHLSEEQQELFAKEICDMSAYRIISSGKKLFSETIVPKLDAEEFHRFQALFDRVEEWLNVTN